MTQPYLIYIVTVMFLLPVLSVYVEFYFTRKRRRQALQTSAFAYTAVLFKWFVFWAVGVRLLTAGLSQVFHPEMTALILSLPVTADVIVKELGLANLVMGTAAIVSLWAVSWRPTAAFTGALYLGAAGVQHWMRMGQGVTQKEEIAMVSDLAIAALVMLYLIWLWRSSRTARASRPEQA